MNKPVCYIRQEDAKLGKALLAGGFLVNEFAWRKDEHSPPIVSGRYALSTSRAGTAITMISIHKMINDEWITVQAMTFNRVRENEGGSDTYEDLPLVIPVPGEELDKVLVAEAVPHKS